MNLLLLEEGEFEIPLSDPRASHVRKILKLTTGDTVRAGIIDGPLVSCTIADIDDHCVRLNVSDRFEPPRPAPVELLLGHPRPIVLRRMLRDLGSLGVSRIHVTATALGEKSYLSSGVWDDTDRLLREGAAQGGFTHLPTLLRHPSLGKAIAALESGSATRITLHPSAGPEIPSLHEALGAVHEWPAAVAVGSERGWTDGELQTLAEAGFRRAHLGAPVLRTEVATAVAVWAARAAWEQRAGAEQPPG